MKTVKIIFLVSAFILMCSTTFSQKVYEAIVYDTANYRVTYNLKAQLDSTNPEWIINRDMFLFIGDECSKFLGQKIYRADTLIMYFKDLKKYIDYQNAQRKGGATFSHKIFKNLPEGHITHYEYFMPTSYILEQPMDLQNWELQDEIDSIAGYEVRKAICQFGGRDWTAWYTTEIPFSDGPYKFNGLPGLILKVYDSRNHFVYEFSEMVKLKKGVPIDLRKKDFVYVTREEFKKVEDNYRESVIKYAKQRGMADESVKTMRQNLRLKNNPIELDRN